MSTATVPSSSSPESAASSQTSGALVKDPSAASVLIDGRIETPRGNNR